MINHKNRKIRPLVSPVPLVPPVPPISPVPLVLPIQNSKFRILSPVPLVPPVSPAPLVSPVPALPLVPQFIIPLALSKAIIGLKNAYLYGK
jgi:hypothetical protein